MNLARLLLLTVFFSCNPENLPPGIEKKLGEGDFSQLDFKGEKFMGQYLGMCYEWYSTPSESSYMCYMTIRSSGLNVEVDGTRVGYGYEMFYEEDLGWEMTAPKSDKVKRMHKESTGYDRTFLNCSEDQSSGDINCNLAMGDRYNFTGLKVD